MNSYELTRDFWDFCFTNPEIIKPNHCALYMFCIEQCNRMGWKEKFGLPTSVAKEAVGIRSYNTYIDTLNDLEEWGFVKIIERSKNQHTANIIALSKFDKALDKALDKATVVHAFRFIKKHQSTCESDSESTIQSTIESNCSIDKPINKETNKQRNSDSFSPDEVVDFINTNFEKEFTTRNVSRFQMEIINELITRYGYTKQQVTTAWLNIRKDPWQVSKKFNVVTFSYLGESTTIERYLPWKEELPSSKTKTSHANSGDGVDLHAEIRKRYEKSNPTT